MDYYTKDDFYFDIDADNQLRVTGAENHLLMGLSFPKAMKIDILAYEIENGQLVIKAHLPVNEIALTIPLVCDIRTLRSYTEGVRPKPTYDMLVKEGIEEVIPRNISLNENGGSLSSTFTNSFEEEGITKYYGSEIIFNSNCRVSLENDTLKISCPEEIIITIRTHTNITVREPLEVAVFAPAARFELERLDPEIRRLYEEANQHIEFLVRTKKTSSFEYGTIFPRDWIESADIGKGDLTQEAVDYMYKQSMKYISESGEGWHEEVVGEFKVKVHGKTETIDRKMIDIEPHYIMGIIKVSRVFLTEQDNHEKFIRVGKYVLNKARENDLITFKKIDEDTGEYYDAGNWRDSGGAFAGQKPPVSPYDVNCIFYPACLGVMRQYHQYFQVEDTAELDSLIEKWGRNKNKYRLYHPDGLIGYSLALHGKKRLPIPVAHLDEAYDLFYGSPSLEEVESFARKIVDPEYFYTPVGPTLVDNDNDEFTTGQYHGKVIWPKQAAYAVAGLHRQYNWGVDNSWPEPVMNTIKNAIIITSEACFRGWKELGAIPELYYYDKEQDRARFFTDQQEYAGQMSIIQLWSSVGARRIVQDYLSITRG